MYNVRELNVKNLLNDDKDFFFLKRDVVSNTHDGRSENKFRLLKQAGEKI